MSESKVRAVGILVLVLLLGVAIGYFGSGFLKFPPANHQAIVDSIIITDTQANFQLTPKLVDSGINEFGKGIPLELFEYGETYPQSTWIWQRHGDTEFVMTIWGPGDDGKTYSIELGRTAGNPFRVTVNGQTKVSISALTNWITDGTTYGEGYYHFYVIVED